MSKKEEQLARMKGLMTYGIDNTPKQTPISESIEGPDGKIYSIIREGVKYFIKTAPKGSKLVAESFDYIGGFMNKKNNEFSSYNQASKNLELKMRSLNEAYGVNKPVEVLNPEKKETLMVEMTESMKESIARYRQIMNNASKIMNENSTISASNTGNPEAPKTSTFNPKLGAPYNQNANAILDKDLKMSANDPKKQGEPYGESEKTEKYKNAEYVPQGSVANQHPNGGKVVRVNEGYFTNPNIPEEDQLPETPDEIDLKENEFEEGVEDYIGFANDEPTTESEEDYDLDNIDVDLDDIDMEDEEEEGDDEIDLDDIDTEDEEGDEEGDEEDDYELEYGSDNDEEIENLKSEVEDLRDMVSQLMSDRDFEDDTDVDYELEVDDLEDTPEESEIEESCDTMNEAMVSSSPVNKLHNEHWPGERLQSYSKNRRSPFGAARIMMDLYKKYEDYLNDDDLYWIEVSMDAFDDLGKCYQSLKRDPSRFEVLKPIIKTSYKKLHVFQSSRLIKLLMDNNEWEMYNLIYDKIEAIEDTFENEFNIDLNLVLAEGVNLNAFGKHVGYRKKPMTLPKTKNNEKEGYIDWNDESVYSEEPFGSKIGSSAPYDKVVEAVTTHVFENLKKKI